MRNDARNQNDINGPVTHGLICDIDLATDRVSRGRQYEITHWPASACKSSASARKNGVNLAQCIGSRKPRLDHPSSSLSWDWSWEHSKNLDWSLDPMSVEGLFQTSADATAM